MEEVTGAQNQDGQQRRTWQSQQVMPNVERFTEQGGQPVDKPDEQTSLF